MAVQGRGAGYLTAMVLVLADVLVADQWVVFVHGAWISACGLSRSSVWAFAPTLEVFASQMTVSATQTLRNLTGRPPQSPGLSKAMMNTPTTGEITMAQNNQVTLIGNVGQDPDTHTSQKGTYVRLTLATTDSYKDEHSGEWQDKKPVWHTVFAFGPTVSGYARSYKKGDRVKVTGSLSYQTTEAVIEGQKQLFTNASIIATRIEDARLPKLVY